MFSFSDQIVASNKSGVEATLKTLEALSGTAQKLADMQLKAGQAAFAEYLKTTKQLARIKDVTELAALTTAAAQPAWDKTSEYAKNLYEVVAGAQADLATLVEHQVAEFNRSMVVTLDAALKTAPAGSESMVSAVKAAVHSTNSVYESMVKGAKQLASTAEANLTAVAAQTIPPSAKRLEGKQQSR